MPSYVSPRRNCSENFMTASLGQGDCSVRILSAGGPAASSCQVSGSERDTKR